MKISRIFVALALAVAVVPLGGCLGTGAELVTASERNAQAAEYRDALADYDRLVARAETRLNAGVVIPGSEKAKAVALQIRGAKAELRKARAAMRRGDPPGFDAAIAAAADAVARGGAALGGEAVP